MTSSIPEYNDAQAPGDREICMFLMQEINRALAESESKIWHGHPVWFLDGNPVAGYSKLKDGVRLLFWSGQSFDEERLQASGKFRAAEICYTDAGQIETGELRRWLDKSRAIQWDYRNIVKRKGRLERIR